MDPAQSRKINEAAEKFAEAVRESLQSVSGRSAEAQERSRELAQSFFDSVSKELQVQTESNRDLSQELIEQSRKQQEALQQLTQESVEGYREFLGSVFSYYQSAMDQARRNAGQ